MRPILSALACLLALLSANTFGATTPPESCPQTSSATGPRACPDPCKSERALQDLRKKIWPLSNYIALPTDDQSAIVGFLNSELYENWCHDLSPRTNDIRTTGPIFPGPNGGLSFGTHARARVYYSQDVVRWLESNREGDIPDGAMIVKEMWAYPDVLGANDTEYPAGWAVMIRDSSASHMGWVWGLYFSPGNQTFKTEYMLVQSGLSYCASCHASTDNSQGTFAFLGNLENRDITTYVEASPSIVDTSRRLADLEPQPISELDGHAAFARYMNETLATVYAKRAPIPEPLSAPNTALLDMLREHIDLQNLPSYDRVTPLPMNLPYDHMLQKGGKKAPFLGSTACSGCHNASNLLNNTPPHGQLPYSKYAAEGFNYLNVTPYGEWQGSMMAMSGRDPIFRAQAEWEAASFDNSPDGSEDAESVTRLCLSCHSAMAERTNPKLAGHLDATLKFPDIALNKHDPEDTDAYEFAALARDGVSCTVCHHISETDLGTKASFTGHFKTGPPGELYGPFEDVKTQPMDKALGIIPKVGAHIQSSELCGSCHTIELPVYDKGKTAAKTYEQTTYLEWVNSDFANKSEAKGKKGDGKTCQECHMPRANPTKPKENLNLPIANIEDSTFPYVPNRAQPSALEVKPREEYRRHTLVAANVFGIGLFQQFPRLLGSNLFWPGQNPDVLYSKILSMEETVKQARTASAAIKVARLKVKKGYLDVGVEITNLAGHKLPSGVGFRRAFVELSVRDAQGQAIWCSGCTNNVGVITDNDMRPLESEFTKKPEGIQQDHKRIDSDKEVQIYEHRSTNCDNELTTSFVRLCKEIKDNRLLPKGWSAKGPYAATTKPVGLEGKPTPGGDVLSYKIPLSATEMANAVEVRARLNYQSIPPYYLIDRLKLLEKDGTYPETERLLYMLLHLNTNGGDNMRNWKVPMACSKRGIDRPSPKGALAAPLNEIQDCMASTPL